jgi:hypothetical protein
MSIVLETWNQVAALTPVHGVNLADHHSVLAAVPIPDPEPEQLPGKMQEFLNFIIGVLKTLCYSSAMIAGLILFIFMALGFRGRSSFAKDALTHYPWVFVVAIGPGALWGILDAVAG